LLILSLVPFYTVYSILKRKYKYILLSLLISLTGLIFIYFYFGSLDISKIFIELSPEWGKEITPLFYSVLTVRNLPIVLISAPISIYLLFKYKSTSLIYLITLIGTNLLFLSLQSAQNERYWQISIPLILIVSIYSLYTFICTIKNPIYKKILIGISILSLIFHFYLFGKELVEIDRYTPTSLSIHKKLEYNSVYEYLRKNITDDDIVVTDFHSTYTLLYKGIDIDYLLLEDDSHNWRWGQREIYFNTPLIRLEDLNEIAKSSDGYLIIRDSEKFPNLLFNNINLFERPTVYRF
jgi:hypothetical protein